MVCDFSQRGTYLDFTAPGEKIPVADMDGEAVYVTGTSFATAYVTGLVANIFMDNTNLKQTPRQIQEMVLETLKESADDVNEDGWDVAYGWGILGHLEEYSKEQVPEQYRLEFAEMMKQGMSLKMGF